MVDADDLKASATGKGCEREAIAGLERLSVAADSLCLPDRNKQRRKYAQNSSPYSCGLGFDETLTEYAEGMQKACRCCGGPFAAYAGVLSWYVQNRALYHRQAFKYQHTSSPRLETSHGSTHQAQGCLAPPKSTWYVGKLQKVCNLME